MGHGRAALAAAPLTTTTLWCCRPTDFQCDGCLSPYFAALPCFALLCFALLCFALLCFALLPPLADNLPLLDKNIHQSMTQTSYTSCPTPVSSQPPSYNAAPDQCLASETASLPGTPGASTPRPRRARRLQTLGTQALVCAPAHVNAQR
jgi:hypothetical protein